MSIWRLLILTLFWLDTIFSFFHILSFLFKIWSYFIKIFGTLSKYALDFGVLVTFTKYICTFFWQWKIQQFLAILKKVHQKIICQFNFVIFETTYCSLKPYLNSNKENWSQFSPLSQALARSIPIADESRFTWVTV